MKLDNLPEYGIAVFSIGAILCVVKWFMVFMKNHIEHHTEVNQRLADTIQNLLDFLRVRNGRGGD